MFEPENDIERQLMRAATEPTARPDFARALMDAEIYLVLMLKGGSIERGPDGSAAIPEGAVLTLMSAQHGDEQTIPFFTAPSRARKWFEGDHICVPDKTRDLFARYPDAAFTLNPGSDYGKEFTPAEIKQLLAGLFDDGPRTIVADKPTQVLLAHPKEEPAALIAALARELGSIKTVRGAWLMLATRTDQPEQTWMLGIDHAGDWDDVRAAIGRAVAGDGLQGRMLDAMPLDSSSLSDTLRTGIPITPAKRGFFNLFR
jgi:SseB protein C-terminal domain/SseB protein N-terminal domain